MHANGFVTDVCWLIFLLFASPFVDNYVCHCYQVWCVYVMAPRMRALAYSQAQKKTHFSLKYFEASITIL